MKRFAIYARYSSDNQKETSIDDQISECSKWVKAQCGEVTNIYKDRAVSGAHFNNRPDLQKLLYDAERNAFDGVVAEDLSRFSRDQEHSAGFFKRLKFYGVGMYTISDNEVTALHIGLKGTVNQIYLSDLADKTRRGQKGAVERGKIPGGISYGYDKAKVYDERGEMIPGYRVINEEQANVIRRIFEEYLLGKSAKAIASALNEDGIPSPRGGQWMASTVNGNPARQNGILCNMLYTGKVVYNRQKFIKNPDTGKRKAILNPIEDWVINEIEELRIIDQATWDKVQSLKHAIAGKPKPQQVRKRHLLSGLIKCSECGGSYTVYSSGRYACSHRRERGTCTNDRTIKIQDLENRILNALESKMLTDEMLQEFSKGYEDGLKDMRRHQNQRLQAAQKELREAEKQIDSIIKAIMDGLYSSTMKETLPPLENKKVLLLKEIEVLKSENIIQIKPNMSALYKQQIMSLRKSLSLDGNAMLEATQIIRSLIDSIIVTPGENRGECLLELKGDLASILNFASGKEVLIPMVAGVGFGHNQHNQLISVVA